MATSRARGTAQEIACCPRCRLVHGGPKRGCRCCGREQQTVPIAELLRSPSRRRLERRTPDKRGLRWFDLVLLAGLILLPLEAERRDPALFVPALLAAAAGWVLVRVLHYLLTHFRLVARSEAPRASETPLPFVLSRDPLSGQALRHQESTRGQLAERPCLISALSLQRAHDLERIRLRTIRAVAFTLEVDPERRYRVEGELVLLGPAVEERPGEDAARLLDGSSATRGKAGGASKRSLDAIWLDGGIAREVLLQHRQGVSLCGGQRDDRARTIVGVPGDPVIIQLT
jgi:hypothetical protein